MLRICNGDRFSPAVWTVRFEVRRFAAHQPDYFRAVQGGRRLLPGWVVWRTTSDGPTDQQKRRLLGVTLYQSYGILGVRERTE